MNTKIKPEDTYQLLSDQIEHKQTLAETIDSTKTELLTATDELSLRNQEVRVADDEVRRQVDNASQRSKSWESDPEYRFCREAVSKARAAYALAKEAHERVQKRVDTLHASLRESIDALTAHDVTIEAGGVIAHQQRLDEAQAQVDHLSALLGDHEGTARQASEVSDPLEELIRKREELLAESALGEDCTDAIARLDAEISEKSQAFDAEIAEREGQIQHATQTAAGLRRRLAAAQAELDRLQATTPEIMKQFLISEIETAGREYIRGAKAVMKNYLKVVALERLYRSHTGWTKSGFMLFATEDLLLPTFRLKACEGLHQHDASRGVLFSGNNAGYKSSGGLSEYDRQAVAERARFEQLGIDPSLIP
jgi:chromosome segregation ATPase